MKAVILNVLFLSLSPTLENSQLSQTEDLIPKRTCEALDLTLVLESITEIGGIIRDLDKRIAEITEALVVKKKELAKKRADEVNADVDKALKICEEIVDPVDVPNCPMPRTKNALYILQAICDRLYETQQDLLDIKSTL